MAIADLSLVTKAQIFERRDDHVDVIIVAVGPDAGFSSANTRMMNSQENDWRVEA